MVPLLRRLLCYALIALLGITTFRGTAMAPLASASSEQENDDEETAAEDTRGAPSLEATLRRSHRSGVSLRLLPMARLAPLPQQGQPAQPLHSPPGLQRLSRLQI